LLKLREITVIVQIVLVLYSLLFVAHFRSMECIMLNGLIGYEVHFLHLIFTKRLSRLVNTPDLYLGGLGFESWSQSWLLSLTSNLKWGIRGIASKMDELEKLTHL
jgi:hypothetical protein